MVKGDSGAAPGHWAIKGADAQTGTLKTYWDGHRAPRYAPMKKQGAIILGIGGDNSDGAVYASRTPHSLQHLVDLASWPVQGDVLRRRDDQRLLLKRDGRRRASQHCRCRLRQVTNTPECRALKSQQVVPSIPTLIT